MIAIAPAPAEDLLPWILRDTHGRWTGEEFATRDDAEQAAIGRPVEVWEDLYVTHTEQSVWKYAGHERLVRPPVPEWWE